jgi:GntR family transcriptional regulator
MAYRTSVIDRHGAHSWYRQLADQLRDCVEQGVYPPGGELPSEAELARQYGVGRDVVRSALALLRQEGLITSVRGTNAKVRAPVARREVTLGAGDELIGRMPSEPERIERLMEYGVPLLAIKRRSGAVELFPGDRVVITGPTP